MFFSGVCLFVSLIVNTITSERLNVGNLAVRCTVHKISPEFEVKVTGDKKTTKCGILFASRPLGRVPGASKRRWENQRMLQSS